LENRKKLKGVLTIGNGKRQGQRGKEREKKIEGEEEKER
jgi:hypothetical protein